MPSVAVEHEEAGEEFLSGYERLAPDATSQQPRRTGQATQIAPRIPKGKANTAERNDPGIEQAQQGQHPAEQYKHNGCRQAQLRPKQRQRHRKGVVKRASDERSEIHERCSPDASERCLGLASRLNSRNATGIPAECHAAGRRTLGSIVHPAGPIGQRFNLTVDRWRDIVEEDLRRHAKHDG